MHDALRNDKALSRTKLDHPIFKIDQQSAFEDEEELVVAIMFMPVVFTLNDANPDDGFVYLA